MKLVLCFALLTAVLCAEQTKHTPPKVQVYSQDPGEYGKDNTLICHVSDFHPPDITIELLRDGEVIPGAKQTDLAFTKGWRFHLTKDVAFTPTSAEKYSCRVTHGLTVKHFMWESNM